MKKGDKVTLIAEPYEGGYYTEDCPLPHHFVLKNENWFFCKRSYESKQLALQAGKKFIKKHNLVEVKDEG